MIIQWARPKALKRVVRSTAHFCRSRRYSTAQSPERVNVPCQSNGAIPLDIHWPLNDAVEPRHSSSVLVYLPRGPLLANRENEETTVEVLRSQLSCPLVQINYRWDRYQRFPTPVHDVLAGYDWILANLLPKRSIGRPGRSDHVGRIAICGELVGGGLATALALTECRVGEPGVVAAAVNTPLVDWVSLDEAKIGSAKSPGKRKPQVLSSEIQKLLSLRREIFKRPVDYFDQFASPILFFRSAGAEIPRQSVTAFKDDMEHLSVVEREEFLRQYGVESETELLSGSGEFDDQSHKPPRKASKRFPSKSLGLRLPSFHISTGSMSPLNGQTSELTSLLRQSITRQSKHAPSNAHKFGRKVLLEGEEDEDIDREQLAARALQQAEAEEKVSFATCEGNGLWDSTPEGRERVVGVARWLNEFLR